MPTKRKVALDTRKTKVVKIKSVKTLGRNKPYYKGQLLNLIPVRKYLGMICHQDQGLANMRSRLIRLNEAKTKLSDSLPW